MSSSPDLLLCSSERKTGTRSSSRRPVLSRGLDGRWNWREEGKKREREEWDDEPGRQQALKLYRTMLCIFRPRLYVSRIDCRGVSGNPKKNNAWIKWALGGPFRNSDVAFLGREPRGRWQNRVRVFYAGYSTRSPAAIPRQLP